MVNSYVKVFTIKGVWITITIYTVFDTFKNLLLQLCKSLVQQILYFQLKKTFTGGSTIKCLPPLVLLQSCQITEYAVGCRMIASHSIFFSPTKTSLDVLHDISTNIELHSSEFTVYVSACIRYGKKYSVLLKKCDACAHTPLSMLYNETVDGWHHYRPCLCQSKNTVQDSNSMWHLCNWRTGEGFGSQAVSMTVQSQCDREGGWGGKIQTLVKKRVGGNSVCRGVLRERDRESSGGDVEEVEEAQLRYHAHFKYSCNGNLQRNLPLVCSIFCQTVVLLI